MFPNRKSRRTQAEHMVKPRLINFSFILRMNFHSVVTKKNCIFYYRNPGWILKWTMNMLFKFFGKLLPDVVRASLWPSLLSVFVSVSGLTCFANDRRLNPKSERYFTRRALRSFAFAAAQFLTRCCHSRRLTYESQLSQPVALSKQSSKNDLMRSWALRKFHASKS